MPSEFCCLLFSYLNFKYLQNYDAEAKSDEIKLLSTKIPRENWQSIKNDLKREKGFYYRNNVDSFELAEKNLNRKANEIQDLLLPDLFSTSQLIEY